MADFGQRAAGAGDGRFDRSALSVDPRRGVGSVEGELQARIAERPAQERRELAQRRPAQRLADDRAQDTRGEELGDDEGEQEAVPEARSRHDEGPAHVRVEPTGLRGLTATVSWYSACVSRKRSAIGVPIASARRYGAVPVASRQTSSAAVASETAMIASRSMSTSRATTDDDTDTCRAFAGHVELQAEIEPPAVICGENSVSAEEGATTRSAPAARISLSASPGRRPVGKARMVASVAR